LRRGKYSVKQVQTLIHRALFWGVWSSGAVMAAGLLLSALAPSPNETSAAVAMAGVLMLVLTPALRLALLCYGYARAGERKFALIAAAVAALTVSGFLFKK